MVVEILLWWDYLNLFLELIECGLVGCLLVMFSGDMCDCQDFIIFNWGVVIFLWKSLVVLFVDCIICCYGFDFEFVQCVVMVCYCIDFYCQYLCVVGVFLFGVLLWVEGMIDVFCCVVVECGQMILGVDVFFDGWIYELLFVS